MDLLNFEAEGYSEGREDGDIEDVCNYLDALKYARRELAKENGLLVSQDRGRVLNFEEATVIALRLFEILPLHPIVTMPGVVKLLETTKPTAIKAIGVLEKLGILVERSGRKRDKTFGYAAYLEN